MSVDADVESRERNEKLSLRILGICFVALAVCIAYESVSDLIRKTSPEHSIPGFVLACVAHRHADSFTAMKADARRTGFYVYPSTIL